MWSITRLSAVTFLALAAPSLRAQPAPTPANDKKAAPTKGVEAKDAGYYLNFSGGRLLPYGIYGVRDIYPYWGARFGHPFGPGSGVEWSSAIVHAKNVRFYTFSSSLTFPSELESWKFIPFVGLDLHYFSGKTNIRQLPFSTSVGGHLGVSPLLEFGPNFALRADFKFNFNPGRSLHVGAGFQYTF